MQKKITRSLRIADKQYKLDQNTFKNTSVASPDGRVATRRGIFGQNWPFFDKNGQNMDFYRKIEKNM